MTKINDIIWFLWSGGHFIWFLPRVSTGKQDADNQRFEILAYASNQKLTPVEFVEETVSGCISFRQRQLGKLIDLAKTGDILIVSELSARSSKFWRYCQFCPAKTSWFMPSKGPMF